ncbi:hypothetical protein K461DRAFT_8642 [Myriangium duriaei CBS 260.36]|uniref:HTH psq-type domain-containing protein n=1 Tax=Myriangium duriaei CBS 260.36 TaxID=1168546 RepID=A0A9P4J7V3_9PEZI|nr:hypothetical protein K461DRAFT_8642 [Myriangium duriaei CBS 260.36]
MDLVDQDHDTPRQDSYKMPTWSVANSPCSSHIGTPVEQLINHTVPQTLFLSDMANTHAPGSSSIPIGPPLPKPYPSMLTSADLCISQQGPSNRSTARRAEVQVRRNQRIVSTRARKSTTTPRALRRTLTQKERIEICRFKERYPDAKQIEIGEKFGVDRSTISKVLSKKDDYLEMEETPTGLSNRAKRIKAQVRKSPTYKKIGQTPESTIGAVQYPDTVIAEHHVEAEYNGFANTLLKANTSGIPQTRRDSLSVYDFSPPLRYLSKSPEDMKSEVLSTARNTAAGLRTPPFDTRIDSQHAFGDGSSSSLSRLISPHQ